MKPIKTTEINVEMTPDEVKDALRQHIEREMDTEGLVVTDFDNYSHVTRMKLRPKSELEAEETEEKEVAAKEEANRQERIAAASQNEKTPGDQAF